MRAAPLRAGRRHVPHTTTGWSTAGLGMRAAAPVSVRTKDDQGSLGNKLTATRSPLPVYIHDPATRLGVVREAMDGLEESKQALGAATIAAVNDLAPPTIVAQASRLNFSTPLFNPPQAPASRGPAADMRAKRTCGERSWAPARRRWPGT